MMFVYYDGEKLYWIKILLLLLPQVERYQTDGALTTFSRKCAKDCTPGCQSAGTSYYKAQYCYHCCQQDLCNTASSAAVASAAAADGSVHGVVTRHQSVMFVTLALAVTYLAQSQE